MPAYKASPNVRTLPQVIGQALTATGPSDISVIRMIKIFGWEARASNQLGEKRQDELRLTRKFKLIELLSNNMKCVDYFARRTTPLKALFAVLSYRR